ncbi:beta/gamma crystallin-related protein [Rheinheimera texasensis]|uniref:beta/gamma crystallin-related protein n=1 Tax=Rheinheimera texasensis TaxID=306205 RepID=UPI0032B24035
MKRTLLTALTLLTASAQAGVTIYQHGNYGGAAKYIASGEMIDGLKENNVFDNDAISSLKVESGTCVVLYQNSGYGSTAKYFSAGNYADLGQYSFNDQASSIQVFQHYRCDSEIMTHFYFDANYNSIAFALPPNGLHRDLGTGNWNIRKGRLEHANDYISSVRVGSGSCVYLYEHNHFEGAFKKFGSNVPDLVPHNFNDITTSVRVEDGPC